MSRSRVIRRRIALLVIAISALRLHDTGAPRSNPIKGAWELRLERFGEAEENSSILLPAVDVLLREDWLPISPVDSLPQAPVAGPGSGVGGTIIHGTNGSNSLQAETTIAANEDGSILLAGYNDGRGFRFDPATGRSISGVSRSIDYGVTWTPGPFLFQGLPVLPSAANAVVLGDPDIKYDRVNRRWLYSSLYQLNSQSGLCIHISTDDGATWTGPFAISPAFESGNILADKEFIDINPATGRIFATWARLDLGSRPATYQIRSTYSDDGRTWSPAQTISAPGIVTGPIPRFYAPPGSTDANSMIFVAWRHIIGNGTAAGLRNVSFTRSLDGGATWSAPIDLTTTSYMGEDEMLGVDRTNTNPSIAVDASNGNIYVVYQVNPSSGEGDIAFQRSTDRGATFSNPVLINSNPGADRSQFFPSVAVDPSNGNIHVVFYDQDADTSGDLTELMHTVSRNGGLTWSRPSPLLNARAFHAGYGNDTSQPNTGDYIQNVARNGVHHAVAMATSIAPDFNEGGQGYPPSVISPDPAMVTPDTYYDRLPDPALDAAALRIGTVRVVADTNCTTGANGYLDPGETADLYFPLRNYTRPNGPFTDTGAYTSVTATLSTTTPGVTVLNATSGYPPISPLSTQTNNSAFSIKLVDNNFVPGSYIDLQLAVSTAQGSITRPYRLATGTPGATTILLKEDFDSTPSGRLPNGWMTFQMNGMGRPEVPWITSTALTPGDNAAYHEETGGPIGGNSMTWERLFSPSLLIPSVSPGGQSYVTVDFDIVYNLEDEPTQRILAYDGATLQIFDASHRPNRSVMVEAFAEVIRTGNINHFPKHILARGDHPSNYFEAVAAWSGISNGSQHVSMKFPAAGMVGHQIQLRFEYTEDENTACQVPPCGVAIDNVVVKHVVSADGSCVKNGAALGIGKGAVAVIRRGDTLIYNVTVTNAGPAAATNVVVGDSPGAGFTFQSNSGDCTTPYPCNLGTIGAGETRLIRSSFSVPSDYPSASIQNRATVTSSTLDPNRSITSAVATTAVLNPNADLAIDKTGPPVVTPGDNVSYVLTVRNLGPADASDVVVRDATPTGLTFVSNTGACTTPFPCALGTLRQGESKTITTQFAVPAAYTAPNPIQNTATVESSSPDPNPSNNSSTATTPLHLLATNNSDKGGCGCTTLGGFPMAGLGVLVLALARRRRC